MEDVRLDFIVAVGLLLVEVVDSPDEREEGEQESWDQSVGSVELVPVASLTEEEADGKNGKSEREEDENVE